MYKEFIPFKEKVIYSLISGDLSQPYPQRYSQVEREFIKMNENEVSFNHYKDFCKNENRGNLDLQRWNSYLQKYFTKHKLITFNKEQTKEKDYVIKVLQYMFNSKKYTNSILGYFGTTLPTGNLLFQTQNKFYQISFDEVINLWKNRKSK